jgi:hypothetical protein
MELNEIIYLNNFGIAKIIGFDNDIVAIEPLYGTKGKIRLKKDSRNIRPLLKKDEIDDIILKVKNTETSWISKFVLRETEYSRIKSNPHPYKLLVMIKTIYNHYIYKKVHKLKGGLSTRDLEFYHKSLDLVTNEFSNVLGIPYNEVGKYISNLWNDSIALEYYKI